MKNRLSLLVLLVLSPLACRALDTNGFLVFEIDRYSYVQGHASASKDIKQSFKIPLTGEFLSNFNRAPSQNSMGTGFYWQGGEPNDLRGETSFMGWIHKTTDGRWSINMWSAGVETVHGTKLNSWNPSISQCVTFRKLEDMDFSYAASYVNKSEGVNVSFGAKYRTAADVQAQGSIPTAPVQKTDQSFLFRGDLPMNSPMTFRCGFQEN